MGTINSVTLEVISNSLLSIVEQMGVILTKTGYSTNIKERKDLSVALFDKNGKLITLAQHIPLHFSSLLGAVSEVLNKWNINDIYEGDTFIGNDPYSGGGSHLPDIVLVKPVFYKGELIAFAVNTGHHADRNIRRSTIYDEGLRIPIIKLYEKDKLVKDVYDLIMLNFQLKEERKGDLRAQLIANQFGENKIIELIDKIGIDTYTDFCREWLKYGERKARQSIKQLPDGIYEFEDYLDDDGNKTEDLLIKLKIIIQGEKIDFDFTESCEQVTGSFNCIRNALLATVYYAVKCLMDNTMPANAGAFESIDVTAREGTLVCSTEPAPTQSRATTTQRIADVIFGAFAKIDPVKVTAAGNGAVSFFNFSGFDGRTGKPYVYLETIGGGSGARFNKDGLDAVQVHMTNTSNLPVEALEMEYPLLVEKYALAENSGGDGEYRGGLGIIRGIRILDESKNTELLAATERTKTRPWGLFGGKCAAGARLNVIRDGKRINTLNKVNGFPLMANDMIELVTAGGGGYGDPSKRSVESRKKDRIEGKVK